MFRKEYLSGLFCESILLIKAVGWHPPIRQQHNRCHLALPEIAVNQLEKTPTCAHPLALRVNPQLVNPIP